MTIPNASEITLLIDATGAEKVLSKFTKTFKKEMDASCNKESKRLMKEIKEKYQKQQMNCFQNLPDFKYPGYPYPPKHINCKCHGFFTTDPDDGGGETIERKYLVVVYKKCKNHLF